MADLGEVRDAVASIEGARLSPEQGDAVDGVVERDDRAVRFHIVPYGGGEGAYRFPNGRRSTGAGCAGALVYTDYEQGSKADIGIVVDIEDATFHESAPDAHCEG